MDLIGSPKQLAVAELLMQGLKSKEIGQQLGMARGTVQSYIRVLAFKNKIEGKKLAVLLVAKAATEPIPMPYGLLTVRHQEVCKGVAAGKSNIEIGRDMGTTEQVIKNYLKVIFDRTGVWSRKELAGWWIARNKTLDKNEEIIKNWFAQAELSRSGQTAQTG
jgi:DNA-binding NarL/FixJ family response regulator